MSDGPVYRLEYARSGQAGCKGPKPCTGTKIAKGALRFGTLVNIQERTSWHWRHWGCLTEKIFENMQKGYRSPDDLDGYEDLEDVDKQRVATAFQEGHVDPADVPESAKQSAQDDEQGADGASSSPEKKKTKTKKAPAKKGKKKHEDDGEEEEEAEEEEEEEKPKSKRSRAKKDTKTKASSSKVKDEDDDDDDAAAAEDGKDAKPSAKKKRTSKAKAKAKKESDEEEEEEKEEQKPVKRSARASGKRKNYNEEDQDEQDAGEADEADDAVKPQRKKPRHVQNARKSMGGRAPGKPAAAIKDDSDVEDDGAKPDAHAGDEDVMPKDDGDGDE